MTKSRFVILITIKNTGLLISFWTLENKHLSNKFEDSYYKVSDELREFQNDRVQFKHRFQEFDQANANRPNSTETNGRNDNGTEKIHDESAKAPDFFQDNNAIKKKFFSKSYTTTRIKSRNFISNSSYVGINKEDFYNRNFALTFSCF